MEQLQGLRTFIANRARLIDKLDESRDETDAWLAALSTEQGINLHDLATLAGIIEMRRDCLNDLVKLDDEFLQNIRAYAVKSPEGSV
jgi:hypothetical protein